MNNTETPSRDWGLVITGLIEFVVLAFLGLITWQFFLCLIPMAVSMACVIAGLIPQRRSRRRWIQVAGLVSPVLATLLGIGIVNYANRLEASIKIIVPSSYRGKFWIVIDPDKGETPRQVDDQWVFTVPASGILIINNDSPFRSRHSESYVFSNGQPFDVLLDNDIGLSPIGLYGYHWTIKAR